MNDSTKNASLNLNATTVRAFECVNNATHCHCAVYPGDGRTCYKPSLSDSTKCYLGKCGSGYHCDCMSNEVCQKLSTVAYVVDKSLAIDQSRVGDETYQFDCGQENVKLPKSIVGHTTDFKVVAYQEFQIFINSMQIGYGKGSNSGEFTAEVHANDIIGLVCRQQSKTVYGVKVSFEDLSGNSRSIDSQTWHASAVFTANWLDPSFDPESDPNWRNPTMVSSMSADLFFPGAPWFWLNDNETIYLRHKLSE